MRITIYVKAKSNLPRRRTGTKNKNDE